MHIHAYEKIWLAASVLLILFLLGSVTYGAVGPGVAMVSDTEPTVDAGAVVNLVPPRVGHLRRRRSRRRDGERHRTDGRRRRVRRGRAVLGAPRRAGRRGRVRGVRRRSPVRVPAGSDRRAREQHGDVLRHLSGRDTRVRGRGHEREHDGRPRRGLGDHGRDRRAGRIRAHL
ncbi:cytochrome C oxidase subunit II [Halorubrum distributum JCM 10118]|uniref:Cytochrome C oxidase subunit II n=1 Tax=Halorubrum distributum JCM 10118 TaxID=1227468 RepID=M0FD95_9EURY|nr:cytochrome C oxidase subunit II [Halorubrum distributum JCM 10118]